MLNLHELKNKNKKAFTLVEIMLLMVVLSLIMASSVAVITRKHKMKPRRAVHGLYICYYDMHRDASGVMQKDGKHEVLISGKSTVKDAPVSKCMFSIPRTASYINVRMVGGGGAGGNAYYAPKEVQIEDTTKDINMLADYTEYDYSYSTPPKKAKITDGSASDDNAYDENVDMGVSEDYVSKKWQKTDELATNSCTTGGGTETECHAIFPASLFKQLLSTYVVDKRFAYDYAGDGESGGGASINSFDLSNKRCKSNTSLDRYDCFKNYVSNASRNYINKPNEKCVAINKDSSGYNATESELKNACPSFFKEEYLPATSDYHEAKGLAGGSGTVFISETKPGFEFYNYPILGWRWNKYNESDFGLSQYSGPSAPTDLCKLIKKLDEQGKPVKDWMKCSFFVNQSLAPQYKSTAVHAGTLDRYDTLAACEAAKGAGKCVQFDKYYEKDSNFTSFVSGKQAPKFSSAPWFDGEDIEPNNNALNAHEASHDGGYPYFNKNIANTGVKLHYEKDKATSYSINDGSGIVTGYINDAYGHYGAGLTLSDLNNPTWWNADGTWYDYPTPASGSAGADGQSYFDTENNSLACALNMGFKFKNTINNDEMLSILGATGYTCNSTKPTDSYGETVHTREEKVLTEDQMALRATLHYYYKYMKYGAPGTAGAYKEIFTRSYTSNILYVEPGEGGTAKPLQDPNTIAADPEAWENLANNDPDMQGKSTIIYYNCVTSGGGTPQCADIHVGGGRSGAAGLLEAPIAMNYTGAEIKHYMQEFASGKAVKKCSYSAPAEEGCTPGSDVYLGQESEFQEVANLLDLPHASFDLTLIGRGGDGGWVVDNCWIVPQYFVIRGLHKLDPAFALYQYNDGTGSLVDDPEDSGILSNIGSDSSDINKNGKYFGWTQMSDAQVQACRTTHKFADYDNWWFKETAGTDGYPGAVVITW